MTRMSTIPQEELEIELQTLKLRRRQIVNDLNDTDTKLIEVKLEMERRQEVDKRSLQDERDLERGYGAFDE